MQANRIRACAGDADAFMRLLAADVDCPSSLATTCPPTHAHARARTMASPLAQAERYRPTATDQSERMARAGARHPSAFAAASARRRRRRRCRRRTAQLRAVRYLSAIVECRKCSRVTSCIGSTKSTVWGYIDRVGLQASCVTDHAVPMPPSPVEADRSRACAQGCARVGEAEDP